MRRRLGLLALIGCAAACGGAAQTDLFDGAGGSAGTNPQGGDPPASTSPPATGSAPSAPPPSCTTTYYRDRDGDGVGGAETKTGCTSPGDEWKTVGGDCDDDNPDVFPGQTAYFGEPYQRKGGTRSFDYDCSTREEQEPPVKVAASTCTLVGNACAGAGYVPVARQGGAAGAGVDPLCGATKFQQCKLVSVGGPIASCEAQLVTADNPVSCR